MKTFKFFKMLAVLIVLITSINSSWAATSSTFYYAIDAGKCRQNNNCCSVEFNVKYDGTNDKWAGWTAMEKTGYTYQGKIVYSYTYSFQYDGHHNWQFRLHEGSNQHYYEEWWGSAWSTDLKNGQLYVQGSGWVQSPTWDASYTIYFVDKYWNHDVKLYAWNSECDYNEAHPGQEMTFTGCYWNGKKIYRLVLNKRYASLKFSEVGGSGYYDNQPCYSNAGKMFTPDETNWWQTPSYTNYTFSNGATVVWDAGNASWTSAYMYHFDLNSADDIALTRLGSSTQFCKTATSNVVAGAWIFRGAQDWNHGITTDVTSNISGVTLFTYQGDNTDVYYMNWQKTENAKKATGSKKVYFDNTDAKWSNIYLKYGTQWFTRATSAATKVTGTANLYYITIPNDIYYKEYFLCDATGSTGYNNIETMTSIGNRIAYQPYNYAADSTFIPTAGTSSSPKVWNTMTKMAGHEHNVSITAPSHGTITVAYKDESNTSQSKTSGSFAVARTCSLTISSAANTGYNPTTLTINGSTHTSGNVHIIKQDITVAATFTPKSCSVTFDKEGGTEGSDGTTATYDADMTTVSVPHKIGYKFDGYWDGDNGTGNQYYKADGTSYRTWNKDTQSNTTLFAKWVSDTKTFNGGGSDKSWTTAGNWSGSAVPSDDWSSVTINAEVELSSAVHIGQLSFGESGKLVIQPTGALEVAGTITNTEANKIEINSSGSNQGALIFNSTGSTAATVTMTMNASDGKFNFIAIPVSYVDVSEAFAGSGVFTYVWDNSENKWDKRGYYDGISAYEAIIAKGIGSTTFSGNLLSNNTNFSSGSLSYSSDGDGNVYMFGNSWTAPIKHSAMTLSGIESMNILNGTSNGWDGVTGDDVIPALQAYVVEVGSSGGSITINYENAVRSVAKGSRNTALKAPQRYADEKPEPITIYVSGNDMRTRIRLFEDATRFSDELDEGWEAYYMEGEGYAGDFYAIGTRKMNVLATSDLEGTVVGFVPGQATSYTISFAGDGKGYYLNDTELELSTLIAEGNTYEFTPNESTNATRFVISKTPIRNTPTGLEEVSEGTKVRKQLIDGVLYIIRDGRIYNTIGALYK